MGVNSILDNVTKFPVFFILKASLRFLGNTVSEKLNLLLTGCVWEAGNPGLLGRLAPNLVEKVLEPDKGRNFVVKASKLFSNCIL